MKKLIILIIITIFLYACGNNDTNANKININIYYPNSTRTDLIKKDLEIQLNKFNIESAINLIKDSENDILPKGIYIEKYEVHNGIVRIHLTDKFKSLSKQDVLVTKGSIVSILTSISNIYGVEFLVINSIDNSDSLRVYTRRNFLFSDEIENRMKSIDVILYLYDRTNEKLAKSVNKIFYNTYENVEMNLLKELVRGYLIAGKDNLETILPKDTKIYSATTVDGICNVRLNSEISKIKDDKNLEFAVYSIVNSLSSIPGINGVRIFTDHIEGIEHYGKVKYKNVLRKNDSSNIVVLPEK